MTFREAVLPFFQFVSEAWTNHNVSSRLKQPRVFLTLGQLVLSVFLFHSILESNGQLTALRLEEKANLSKLEIIETKLESLQSRQAEAGKADSSISKTVLGLTVESPTPTPQPVVTVKQTSSPVTSFAPLGMIQVVNSGQGLTTPVYDDPQKKNVVSRVSAGTILFYSKKSEGWYRVDIPDSDLTAWIAQSFVSELQK